MNGRASSPGTNCSRCGARIPRNRNRCPSCLHWSLTRAQSSSNVIRLSEADDAEMTRLSVGLLDNVLGGGLVISSVILIAGAPGAGKSTISLQVADLLTRSTGKDVLFILSEEKASQVKDRAKRLGVSHPEKILCLSTQEVSAETNLASEVDRFKPVAVVVDSLAGMSNDPEQQVDICKAFKDQYAMKFNIPFVVIHHVNKGEEIAGLMKLQHAVDGCFTFAIDDATKLRVMNVQKNRFGANKEEIFRMDDKGLHAMSRAELREMGLVSDD